MVVRINDFQGAYTVIRSRIPLTFSLTLFLFFSFNVPTFGQDQSYLDATLSVDERVEILLAQMTLEEKIGQMTLVEKNSISADAVGRFFIGGVLSGGGGYPLPNTPEAWAQMVGAYQEAALSTRLAIPMIYGVDAVHGHNNVEGAVIFPHNIGLGATRNPELVEQIGRITAQEMIATGIYWDYAPVVAVPQDIRWGRTYEGYSENTDLVIELSTAFLLGLQGENLSDPDSVLGTPKHFVGDGGAVWGTSPFGPNNIDRGLTDVDEETLREIHLPPYAAAIEAGARSIMISYSGWGGLHMHAQQYLITDVLKDELGFDGFIVSDWEAIDQITTDYFEAVVTSINAGVDMNMVPQAYTRFIEVMLRAVESGDISMERVDDAVRCILRVKFEMGLFEHPFGDEALLAEVGSEEHRAVAREAVSQSLVLLKNENDTLPIAPDTPTIFIGGSGVDDIGMQSGGWTIEWQGQIGDITPGTTIRDGIEALVSETTNLHYNRFGRFVDVTDEAGNPAIADVGIVVVGEMPYAEWQGDNAALDLSDADVTAIENMREHSQKLVVILISGRPMIITEQLALSDAFVAAWLPGTEGQGVADVLFGNVPFSGRLPVTWPRSVDQLPFDFDNLATEGEDAPLFPYGYGLTFENSSVP
jgi:beta-glucosidase